MYLLIRLRWKVLVVTAVLLTSRLEVDALPSSWMVMGLKACRSAACVAEMLASASEQMIPLEVC